MYELVKRGFNINSLRYLIKHNNISRASDLTSVVLFDIDAKLYCKDVLYYNKCVKSLDVYYLSLLILQHFMVQMIVFFYFFGTLCHC